MRTLIRKNVISQSDDEAGLLLFEDILYRIKRHPGEPQSMRVEELLELLSGLRDDLSTREGMRVITRLRKVLDRYQWRVQVSPTSEGFRAVYSPPYGLSASDDWEQTAVGRLLEFVPNLGKRPRIRRCAVCNEWFFAAKRADHIYCSGACKQRHHDGTPEMRENKKLYMRKRRAKEKRLEEKSKKAIGYRGPVKRRAKSLQVNRAENTRIP
jgi:hypothetical protein